jgi:cytochrome P450
VRRFRRAQRRLDATIYRLIEERRADGADRGDLLSMLLLARDAEGDGAAMDDRQVRDEAMTLFLAGHETTAVALAWTWRLLSENPEAEALLHRELDEVLDGRLPAVEDVPRLEVTRGVFAESLRLYPPAWVIGRLALTAVEIGGFRVPRRSLVLTSPWVTHRDPRWWPDPSAFDPTRWSPAAEAARPRFAYFPFGGGPRVCIGEPFAWLEGILVLATLARGWRMRLVAGHAARLHPLITLRPRGGLPARLERRRPDRGLTRA